MPTEEGDLLPPFLMVVVDLITAWRGVPLRVPTGVCQTGVCLHVWVLPESIHGFICMGVDCILLRSSQANFKTDGVASGHRRFLTLLLI